MAEYFFNKNKSFINQNGLNVFHLVYSSLTDHYIPLCNVQFLTQFLFLLKTISCQTEVVWSERSFSLLLLTYAFSSAANHSVMTKL